jgi:hypothetical protein
MAESAPPCAEKTRLLAVYTTATSDYSRALDTLRQRMGVLGKGEYDRWRWSVERARTASEQARSALERHVKEHGC